MRRLVNFGLLILLAIGLATVWNWLTQAGWLSRFIGSPQTTTNQGILLTKITQIGKLELVQYNFKDIVEHEQAQMLLPNAKAILIVEGEAIGCIDLSRIKPADIQTTSDSVIIHLPPPDLCVWKINHERSRIYDTQWALLNPEQLVSDAYRQAERQMRQSALQGGLLAQTRQSADRVLRPLLQQVAGKPVRLVF
jgi:hypothetical protein